LVLDWYDSHGKEEKEEGRDVMVTVMLRRNRGCKIYGDEWWWWW